MLNTTLIILQKHVQEETSLFMIDTPLEDKFHPQDLYSLMLL
jgi:hypothetical protein